MVHVTTSNVDGLSRVHIYNEADSVSLQGGGSKTASTLAVDDVIAETSTDSEARPTAGGGETIVALHTI